MDSDEFKEHLLELNKETGRVTDSQKLTGIILLLEKINFNLLKLNQRLEKLTPKAPNE